MTLIRKEPRSSDGWNNGDLDVVIQLFRCGMVWDGNLASNSSRDYLVEHGYAVRAGGYQALTGKGSWAFLTNPRVWRSLWRRWRHWGGNPLVTSDAADTAAID